eukprot:1547603-Alexandrium_andersonii.AAC.1
MEEGKANEELPAADTKKEEREGPGGRGRPEHAQEEEDLEAMEGESGQGEVAWPDGGGAQAGPWRGGA